MLLLLLLVGCPGYIYLDYRADRAEALAYAMHVAEQLGSAEETILGTRSYCTAVLVGCIDSVIFSTTDTPDMLEQRIKQLMPLRMLPRQVSQTNIFLGGGSLKIDLSASGKVVTIGGSDQGFINIYRWPIRDPQNSQIEVTYFSLVDPTIPFVLNGNALTGSIVRVELYHYNR
jgi:hypothetical protein